LDPEPLLQNIVIYQIIIKPINTEILLGLFGIIVLLASSALVSGSEVAYFSLTNNDVSGLKLDTKRKTKYVCKLLEDREQLLATILIANNFINVGIVILSAWVTNEIFDFSSSETFGFIFQIIIITFLLLFFGEILPKVYATNSRITFAKFTSMPLFISKQIFKPVSNVLIKSTTIVNRLLSNKNKSISIQDLSDAYELTEANIREDKQILEGVINFWGIDVKEIMKPRVDIVAVDVNFSFNKLQAVVIESGFSRIPVYKETHDNLKGILYVKDLLPCLNKSNDFNWQKLIREPYFIPETMKISDLLEKFQTKKIHIAIVTDEYGGFGGIVTMEDVIEEIVGEIHDDVGLEEDLFVKIDENNYIFNGKILLNDFYKILGIKEDIFIDKRGDADSLAGLILEIKGEIPQKGEKLILQNFTFVISSADDRKIKKINLKIDRKE